MDISRNSSIQNSAITLCRYCNSPIMTDDKICKHCFEYQRIEEQENINIKDSSLSIYDWIIIFASQLLGMLVGLAHYLRGEILRGKRIIGYSFGLLLSKLIITGCIYSIFKSFITMIKMN